MVYLFFSRNELSFAIRVETNKKKISENSIESTSIELHHKNE